MTVTPASLHPGSPFLLHVGGLTAKTTYDVRFDDRMLTFRGSGEVDLLLGVDLSHPVGGDDVLLYRHNSALPLTYVALSVKSHVYPDQHLTLPRGLVELTPPELKRALREQKALDVIFADDRTRRMWEGGFIMPVEGAVSSPFGGKRFLNGEPRSPHTGIDIEGKPGEPVVASNDGVVRFEGSLFFGGNSIIIDHGQGVYSMYFHLQRYAVKKLEYVQKGQIIGYIGDTGRVTGPSIHFGIRIVDSRIDPELLFALENKNNLKKGGR